MLWSLGEGFEVVAGDLRPEIDRKAFYTLKRPIAKLPSQSIHVRLEETIWQVLLTGIDYR